MAGIFNANIFNNLVFNTGATSPTGRSGWYRLWLADLQSKFLQDYHGETPAPVEEVVAEKIAKPHPIKEHKDGSVTVLPFKKKPLPKIKPEVVEALAETVPTHLKLKPMYRMDTAPSYVAETAQITSTLRDMVEGFKPVVARMEKTKADNDEDEDVLFLLMAA